MNDVIESTKCCCVLINYNFYNNTYPTLYLSYKLLLSIYVTQVGCERSFSKLKYLKNYLRNSMIQDHIESFIFLSVEKDILVSISSDNIIDRVALNSKLLIRLLIY